jgi:hypothetical protein
MIETSTTEAERLEGLQRPTRPSSQQAKRAGTRPSIRRLTPLGTAHPQPLQLHVSQTALVANGGGRRYVVDDALASASSATLRSSTDW